MIRQIRAFKDFKGLFQGFTLAEVLVTLGIIGVVAAMTLPTLINDKQNKELEAAFKKSYSLLAQVTQRVILEDYGGQIPENKTSADLIQLMDSYQKYYIKSSTCKRNESACSSVFPISKGNQLESFINENYKTFSGKGTPAALCNDGIMATIDGGFIFFDIGTAAESTYGTIFLAVDTNGWRKKPNRYGYDFFLFQISSNGKLLPMGAEGTVWKENTHCSNTSTTGTNGYGCTSKALNNPNYFKNLPK